MMSLFYSKLIIFKVENEGFENTILLHGKTTPKFQKLPPLPAFCLSGSSEKQIIMPCISLISCHLLLDLSARPFYISLSI